jgi:hypothetical protein
MNAAFLDRLAEQLRSRRSPACRRAIGRILSNVKSGWEEGKYYDGAEAERAFRELVEKERVCRGSNVDNLRDQLPSL